MRLPRLFLIAAFAALCVSWSFAADGKPAEANAGVITQAPHSVDNPLLAPEMFIPPHAWQKSQSPAFQQAPDSADSLCYNIHSVVVVEDDHTGVTRRVRESTCTRATRFQMKNADAAAK